RGTGWPILALASGAARFMSDLHGRGLAQRADQGAFAELDLEGVVGAWRRIGEGEISCAVERLVVERDAFEPLFRGARTPRHGGDAAERDTRLTHRVAVHLESDRGGGQRELVGFAIADFEIA